MKKLYFLGLFAIVTAGIFFILKFSYKPSLVKIMKPSFFSKPEEIGAVTFRRFYSPISEKKRVVIGIPPQPEHYLAFIRGFLEAAAAEKLPFDAVIAEREMPALNLAGLPPIELVTIPTNTPTQAELIEKLGELTAAGKRVLVYLPSVFSTHVLNKNVVNRFEQQTGERLFTITAGPLSLRPNQEYLIDPACVGSERDSNGTSELGCAFLQESRRHYRKQVAQDQWVATMASPKPEDYIVAISVPGQGGDAADKNLQMRMRAPGDPEKLPTGK